jgi:polyhydroxyalkanoate synthesis regulator phasin
MDYMSYDCRLSPRPYTIREMAEAIRTRRVIGINNLSITYVKYDKIGDQWVPRFIKRHPELATIMPEQIEAARITKSSREVLQKWFDDVQSLIKDYNIQQRDIYNMDETGYSIGSIKARQGKPF